MRCFRPNSFLTSRGSSNTLWRLGREKRRCFTNNQNYVSNPSKPPHNLFVRPLVFSGAVCFGSFGAVAIWNVQLQEEVHNLHVERQGQEATTVLEKIKTIWRTPANQQQRIVKAQQEKREFYIPSEWGRFVPHFIINAVEDVVNDDKVGPIIVANVLLHGLLSVFPGMKWKWFVHDPASGRALPMLLSAFAHMGLVHLGFNMAALWTVGYYLDSSSLCYDDRVLARKEQYWAAYMSAGTLTSLGNIFASQLMKSLRRIPMSPSLGASGAICAFASSLILIHGDNLSVSVVFLPHLPAMDVLKAGVAFDMAGLLCGGFLGLGHGAHLGGYLIGYWAVEMDGLRTIWAYQAWVDRTYRALKKTFLAL